MKPSSAKAKGKKLEDYIADKIVSKGIDGRARRDGASGAGTREKGDIITSATVFGRNLGIEAKNHKTPHIKDWWLQAQKLEVLGREPVLAYKLENEQYEETKVVIYLDTFLDMIKALSEIPKPQQEISISKSDNNYPKQQIKFWLNKIK